MNGEGARRIVVVGGSGHGREVVDLIRAANEHWPGTWDLVGVADDGNPAAELLEALGTRVIGSVDQLRGLAGCSYVVGVGSGAARQRIADRCDALGLVPAVVVHPAAVVGSPVSLGPGTVVCALATVTTNVTLGRHVLVNRNCAVGHDCVLADFSTVHPGASVAGSVGLGAGSTIGAGASVIQGVQVGAGAMVGAGAVVIRSVEPDTTVVGVPARPVKRGRWTRLRRAPGTGRRAR